jgi:hypothetical protein
MSARAAASTRAGGAQHAATIDDPDRGFGWVAFAGAMLLLAGVINFIDGVAAISASHFYVSGARYVIGDLNTWGWVVLLLGVAQALSGLGVLTGNQIARWSGVAFAGLNAIAQLMFIPAYPLWSVALFAVDIVVLYSLIVHGGRVARAD